MKADLQSDDLGAILLRSQLSDPTQYTLPVYREFVKFMQLYYAKSNPDYPEEFMLDGHNKDNSIALRFNNDNMFTSRKGAPLVYKIIGVIVPREGDNLDKVYMVLNRLNSAKKQTKTLITVPIEYLVVYNTANINQYYSYSQLGDMIFDVAVNKWLQLRAKELKTFFAKCLEIPQEEYDKYMLNSDFIITGDLAEGYKKNDDPEIKIPFYLTFSNTGEMKEKKRGYYHDMKNGNLYHYNEIFNHLLDSNIYTLNCMKYSDTVKVDFGLHVLSKNSMYSLYDGIIGLRIDDYNTHDHLTMDIIQQMLGKISKPGALSKTTNREPSEQFVLDQYKKITGQDLKKYNEYSYVRAVPATHLHIKR